MEYNGKSEQIFSMPKNNVKKCFDYRENFKKTRKGVSLVCETPYIFSQKPPLKAVFIN